ncbi:DUF6456 domain-containing protein [Frigidibacter mobilis]|uniref:DUF6456 domain-containing protein n=1 Tax=Frigidibacter mobilis TaxID=1335048 RepID=A0A159Z1A4_9RHOB|nr:DUF6456 domain-containing protein [Frigidibacter mobilis]AMY68677.1 hypothetical protein AKL17_1423 [Frigidibacter mobilis]
MTISVDLASAMPAWLPDGARLYLRHIEGGQSIREIARAEGCHASTILRRVRRIENRRDDPLVDEALARLGQPSEARAESFAPPRPPRPTPTEESLPMSAPIRSPIAASEDQTVLREARRILRRLCEPGAILAVAPDMDKAAVLKGAARIAVTDRTVAQAFALKDWIACARQQGRVAIYEITTAGKAALKRLLAEDAGAQGGFAEAAAGFDPQPFADQHRVWAERPVMEPGGGGRRLRYNLAESPLAVLARRREKDGKPFLTPDLVAAAERLREDFELAQMGPRVAQNWDRFLTGGDRGSFQPEGGPAEGPRRARDRVAAALRDLGPGLGDMALRCCCYLEGLETAERRMGWSARSGKIVLRIALMRLKRHYDETYGGASPLIG